MRHIWISTHLSMERPRCKPYAGLMSGVKLYCVDACSASVLVVALHVLIPLVLILERVP